MPLNPTYSAGTVSVTAGGTTVTGNLTLWLAAGIREGDVFECRGLTSTIAAVNSSTSITLVRPWFGATVTGAEYEIRYIADASRVIGAARTVVERFEASQPLFDGAYASYENLLDVVPTLSPTVRAIKAVVAGIETRWVRDASGTALGGGWAPADIPMPQNYGGANAASLAAAVAGNANSSVRINYDEANVPANYGGVLLEYTKRARFRTVGAATTSTNAAQRLFRGQMPSRAGGPRSIVFGVEMEAIGSGTNGPGNADLAFEIHADKRNYLSASAERGEIDGAYIFVRQGNQDDAGGLLIDARKTRLGTGDTGGIVGIECLSGINNGSGVLTQYMQTIIGFQEGAGGFTGAKGCGVAVEARVGNTHSGFAAISRTDIAGTTLDWSYYAGLTRSPADRIFGVNGATGAVHIGPAATEVTLRHNATNLDVHRTDGTRIGRFRSSGIMEATSGVLVSSDSSPITRLFTATASLDFPSIAAQSNQALTFTVTGAAVGDLAIISPTTIYTSGNLVFTARVTAANTVTIHCQNISTAAIDPAAQTLKIMIVRF